jgi:hypothetical protein
MVDYVSDASVLLQGFRAFAFSGEAPEEIEDQLQKLPGTDADVICSAAEVLYAHYDLLTDTGKRRMAELFNYAVNQHWSGFNQGDRSAQIVTYTARALGDEGAILPPPEEEWPEPQANRRDSWDWRYPDGALVADEPAEDPVPAE